MTLREKIAVSQARIAELEAENKKLAFENNTLLTKEWSKHDALQARIVELEAVDFALDGQDPTEHADLKLARCKVNAARAALIDA